ncbi:MAG TPA: acyl-CoA dehydrogenase family protein [Actinomycetota bacterium]|nr:acyl-CoA dehydrogenase family protein [Actinomycetota bacterium]
MSGFGLTEAQQQLAEKARRIGREVLAPIARDGLEGRVNRRLVKALADRGLLPRLFPGRAGGAREGEISAVELCVVREALARESTEAETALAMQGLGGYPILQSGTEATIRRWVPPIARGDAVAAFALTEPGHGSDAAAIELRADRDGDGYRLSGVKTWISNAPDADVYVVFARTTPATGARGVTAFVVPGDAEGVSGAPIELLAAHPIGRLELDTVRVAVDQVLGKPNEGFRVAMRTLDLFRPSVGAFAVGMAQAALDASLSHAEIREVFGKPLRELQSIAHLLAEMATRTEAARLLVYAAASAYDGGERVTRRSAMAKLFATETAQWVVDSALQVHGASGLERGHLLEHLYREVRAPRIYEGTSEIQREIIARELFRERGDA